VYSGQGICTSPWQASENANKGEQICVYFGLLLRRHCELFIKDVIYSTSKAVLHGKRKILSRPLGAVVTCLYINER